MVYFVSNVHKFQMSEAAIVKSHSMQRSKRSKRSSKKSKKNNNSNNSNNCENCDQILTAQIMQTMFKCWRNDGHKTIDIILCKKCALNDACFGCGYLNGGSLCWGCKTDIF